MARFNFKDYSLEIPRDVYFPSEDTELLLESLEIEIIKKDKKYNVGIEVGFGNALPTLLVYERVTKMYAVDLNPLAVSYLLDIKTRYDLKNLKVKHSDLFSSFESSKKFDLIIFNPPYVPTEALTNEKGIDLAVNGGIEGREIIDKFINYLPDKLNKYGKCYLLISSLNNPTDIIAKINEKKLAVKIINTRKLFFEELVVLKINW